MARYFLTFRLLLLTTALLWAHQFSAAAQSVREANDNVGTQVRQQGDRYDIDGGSRSRNGRNLFHSFERFGLSDGEIANFLSDPDVRNILGRVTGGDASFIDGLLRVSGGDANLFLINPAGILFGENARLDLLGDFTATTATGIGFGSGAFPAVGETDYSALVGDPETFTFDLNRPGAVVNQGDLATAPGQSLTLLGGQVINTGTLTSPGGTITVAAVEGNSRVRITQDGMLLGLELDTQTAPTGSALPFTPLSLPALLTGGQTGSARDVTVAADGSIRLSGGTMVADAPGTAIASGTLDASDPAGSTAQINVVGDRVVVADALLNASGADGGTVRIGGGVQGDGNIPNASDTLFTTDSAINADAVRVGDGGTVVIWSNDSATIAGEITARGGSVSGDGGFIETSGRQTLNLTSMPDASAPNGDGGTWLIDPTDITIVAGDNGAIGTNQVGVENINTALNAGTNVTITTDIGGNEVGDITQNADAAIEKTAGGDAALTLLADTDIVLSGGISTIEGRLNVTLTAGSDGSGIGRVVVDTAGIASNGGDITIAGAAYVEEVTEEVNGVPTGPAMRTPRPGVALAAPIQSDGGEITITSVGRLVDPVTMPVPDSPITIDAPINAGTGPVTLQADILPDLTQLGGSGLLQLQPNSDGTAIAITRDAPAFPDGPGFTINPADIPASFSNLIIGDLDRANPITVNEASFAVPVALQTAGTVTFDAGDGSPLILNAPDLLVNAETIQAPSVLIANVMENIVLDAPTITGELNLNPENDAELRGTTLIGDVDIISGGSILIDTALEAGSVLLDAGRDITLNNSTITAIQFEAEADNDIIVADDLSLTFGPVQPNATSPDPGITLIANGNGIGGGDVVMDEAQFLTISGARNLTVAGDNVTLGQLAVGDFFNPELEAVQPAADVTLSATGNLLVAGIESRANDGTPSGGDISLSSTTGDIRVSGDIITEADAGNAEVDVEGGNVVIAANGGEVDINGSILTTARGSADAGAANGGSVAITAINDIVTVNGAIASPATAGGGTAAGGDVTITADNIVINDADQPDAIDATALDEAGPPQTGGAIALRAPDGIEISGDLRTTNAAITLTGPTTLTGAGDAPTISNQNTTGAIAVNGAVEAPDGLIVSAGSGNVTFGGDVTATNSQEIRVESAGVTQFNGDVSAERLSTDAPGRIDLGNNRTLTVNALDLGGEIGGRGALTLRPLSRQDIAFIPDADMAIAGALNLTNDVVARLAPFTSLTVGTASTRNITLDPDTRFPIATRLVGDRLIGPDRDTTYRFSGDDQGRIFGLSDTAVAVTFETIEAVTGGAGDDTFTQIDNFTGALDGGAGFNTAVARPNGTLTLAALTGLVNIDEIDGNGGTLLGTGGADTFTLLEQSAVTVEGLTIQNLAAVDGGAGGDRFQVQANINLNGFVRGGSGQDELDFSGLGQGLTLNLTALDPDSIERITGTDLDDTIFLGGGFGPARFDGTIDGGLGRLILSGGTLDLSAVEIFSEGDLEITGAGAITTGNLRNPGRDITINGDAITAGTIDTRSPLGSSADGGNIRLTAATTIETEDLLTTGNSGGDVTVQTETAITTGRIDTSGRVVNGGNVLLDPERDIEVVSINAQGGPTGTGGDVDITTERFFRATGDFINRDSIRTSISTSGGRGGTITIRHGGNDETPFTIGVDGALLENGTAAAITSNGDQLAAPQSILGDRVEGRIRLETGEGASPLPNPGPDSGPDSGPDPSASPSGLLEAPCPPNCNPIDAVTLPSIASNVGSGGTESPVVTVLSSSQAEVAAAVEALESEATNEFSNHLGLGAPETISLTAIIANLQDVQKEAGIAPAILYATFGEDATTNAASNRRLELVLITADGPPLHIQIPEATQAQVQTAAARLRRQVSIPSRVGTTTYEESAQQLHRWLIDPIEADLAARGIDTLGIVTDAGLRSLPFAALSDGDSFLIERYALTLVPSLSLTYLDYENIQQGTALLGGSSSFANQAPLPFVPLELSRIQSLWEGAQFQGENFTRKALRTQIQQDYGIIHLATHGEFQPGRIDNSYIQFSDGRLAIDALQELEWQPENIRLVTLSACQTALGNREAELGFAGLAVSAGAQSALASLWSVNDAATTGLMVSFYENLRTEATKADALREAQLAMIAGQFPLSEWIAGDNAIPAADPILTEDDLSFRHPYYWSAFTLVGSPW